MSKKKPFIGIDHGTGKIDLSHLRILGQYKPTEIHFKQDGDLDDNPSVAIVMEDGFRHHFVGQLSLNMWNKGLADIGYKIEKI